MPHSSMRKSFGVENNNPRGRLCSCKRTLHIPTEEPFNLSETQMQKSAIRPTLHQRSRFGCLFPCSTSGVATATT